MTAHPPIKNIRLRGTSIKSRVDYLDTFHIYADFGKTAPCPDFNGDDKCMEDLDYWPPTPADPETGTAAWGGGYRCDVCKFVCEDEPVEKR